MPGQLNDPAKLPIGYGILSLIEALIHQCAMRFLNVICTLNQYIVSYAIYNDETTTLYSAFILSPLLNGIRAFVVPLSSVLEEKTCNEFVVLLSALVIIGGHMVIYFGRANYLFIVIGFAIYGIGSALSVFTPTKKACEHFPKIKGILSAVIGCLATAFETQIYILEENKVNPGNQGTTKVDDDRDAYPEDVSINYYQEGHNKIFFYGFPTGIALYLILCGIEKIFKSRKTNSLVRKEAENRNEQKLLEKAIKKGEEGEEEDEDTDDDEEDEDEFGFNVPDIFQYHAPMLSLNIENIIKKERENRNSKNLEEDSAAGRKERKMKELRKEIRKERKAARKLYKLKEEEKFKRNRKIVLKSCRFWNLFLASFLVSFLPFMISSIGKTLGAMIGIDQKFIKDLWSYNNYAQVGVSILWGFLVDVVPFKCLVIAMCLFGVGNTALLILMMKNKVCFAIAIVVNSSIQKGINSVFLPYIMKIYGIQYSIFIAGILFYGFGISGIGGAALAFFIKKFQGDSNILPIQISLLIGIVTMILAFFLFLFETNKKFEYPDDEESKIEIPDVDNSSKNLLALKEEPKKIENGSEENA